MAALSSSGVITKGSYSKVPWWLASDTWADLTPFFWEIMSLMDWTQEPQVMPSMWISATDTSGWRKLGSGEVGSIALKFPGGRPSMAFCSSTAEICFGLCWIEACVFSKDTTTRTHSRDLGYIVLNIDHARLAVHSCHLKHCSDAGVCGRLWKLLLRSLFGSAEQALYFTRWKL